MSATGRGSDAARFVTDHDGDGRVLFIILNRDVVRCCTASLTTTHHFNAGCESGPSATRRAASGSQAMSLRAIAEVFAERIIGIPTTPKILQGISRSTSGLRWTAATGRSSNIEPDRWSESDGWGKMSSRVDLGRVIVVLVGYSVGDETQHTLDSATPPPEHVMIARHCTGLILVVTLFGSPVVTLAIEPPTQETQILVGTGPGWRTLGEDDFAVVNTDSDTFTFHEGGLIKCKGTPIGVLRTKQEFTNFELVVEWRHLESGGNSGIFAWVDPQALDGLPPNKLPRSGIEIQMLDHGYVEKYTKAGGKKADWFTTNGDVFAVGESTMKPFPPLSPNGRRSFPREEHSNGVGQWNRYYVRAINGELRLWVNGHEVSGGNACRPNHGCLCLESEGAPLEFRNLRVRELP